MLSLTIAFPDIKTASQAITQPLDGMIMTSPGTKCVVGTSAISKHIPNIKQYYIRFSAKLQYRIVSLSVNFAVQVVINS